MKKSLRIDLAIIGFCFIGIIVWSVLAAFQKPASVFDPPVESTATFRLCEMYDGRFEIHKELVSRRGNAWVGDGTWCKIWPIGWTCENRFQAEKTFEDVCNADAKARLHRTVKVVIRVSETRTVDEFIKAEEAKSE